MRCAPVRRGSGVLRSQHEDVVLRSGEVIRQRRNSRVGPGEAGELVWIDDDDRRAGLVGEPGLENGLIGLGVDRILTSGQEPSVIEGLDLIAELVQIAGQRVIIMPGGGTERNVGKVVARSGVREVHVTGTTSVGSAMHFRNQRVFMGGELRPPEYTRLTTDPERIRQLRREVTG